MIIEYKPIEVVEELWRKGFEKEHIRSRFRALRGAQRLGLMIDAREGDLTANIGEQHKLIKFNCLHNIEVVTIK